MKKINKTFDAYDFISLYSFIKMSEDNNPIIEQKKLENELYYFYDNPKYKHLFREIYVDRENNIDYVNLHNAFIKAYLNNVLNITKTSKGTIFEINRTQEESTRSLTVFDEEEVSAMRELFYELKEKEFLLSKLIELRTIAYTIDEAQKLIVESKKIQMEIEEIILKEEEKLSNNYKNEIIRKRNPKK